MGNLFTQIFFPPEETKQNTLIDYNPEDYKNDGILELNPGAYPNLGNYFFHIMEGHNCSPQEVCKLPQLEQMKFGDAITRRYAKNNIFLSKMKKSSENYKLKKENINVTAIGNFAFIAYHNPYYDFFTIRYRQILDLFKE